MDAKAMQVAINNGNTVTIELANRGLFTEAGVIHSLSQVIRVLYAEGEKNRKDLQKAITSDSRSLAMLRQVRSDLTHLTSGDEQVTVDVRSLFMTIRALDTFIDGGEQTGLKEV